MAVRIGTDLIEIERISRALERPGLPRPLLHAGRAGVLRVAPQPGRVLRRAVLRQGGGREGARVRRPLHVEGDRDRRPSEARRDARGQDARLRGAGGHARARRLADPLAHDGRRDVRRGSRDAARSASTATSTVMHEPLYTAAEMRAAEERYPGYPGSAGELMERAGAAVAAEVLRAFPEARRIAAVCGGGANGGDGRIAARILREAGRDVVETDDPSNVDLVLDALFGTGFHGAPRPEAAAAIERINACGAPVVAGRPSVRRRRVHRRDGGRRRRRRPDRDLPRPQGRPRRRARALPRGSASSSRTSGSSAAPTAVVRATPALLDRVPRRGARDTKFSSGSLLVVGGAPGTTSAAVLTATAAMRADAGYVTLAVPAEALPVAEALALEPVKRGFEWANAADSLGSDVARSSALAVGPGLGRSDEARALVRTLLETLVAAGGRRRGRALRPRAGRRATRPPFSLRTPASWRGCSTWSPRGSPRTGSRPLRARPSASARSSC